MPGAVRRVTVRRPGAGGASPSRASSPSAGKGRRRASVTGLSPASLALFSGGRSPWLGTAPGHRGPGGADDVYGFFGNSMVNCR